MNAPAGIGMGITDPTRGNAIYAYDGRIFYPFDPRPEEVDINWIAHALAHQCRYGGMCREFYSVAQHSVYVSMFCDPEDAMWGLLHDASEAYVIDIPRPLKYSPAFAGYRPLEKSVMDAIMTHFGMSLDQPHSVKVADEMVLASEARDLMGDPKWNFAYPPVDVEKLPRVPSMAPDQAKAFFLERFHTLALDKLAAESR